MSLQRDTYGSTDHQTANLLNTLIHWCLYCEEYNTIGLPTPSLINQRKPNYQAEFCAVLPTGESTV